MLNDILDKLYPYSVKKHGENRYEAKCPCHDDKTPSLVVYVNDDWVNIKCMAGCADEDVMKALGLKKKDLYIGCNPHKSKNDKQVINETVYPYKKADGTLVYSKKRIDYEDGTKTFLFILPDGTYGLKGTPHIPFNLPEVSKADTIYFVEGEKCAESVIKQGFVATTLDSGSNSKFPKPDSKYFKGKNVIILPDNDKPGMDYALKIKRAIPWAIIKQLPDLPPKGDIYDWLQAGHSMAEIESLPESVFDDEEDNNDTSYTSDKRQQSTVLLDIIKSEKSELFLDGQNEAYAEIIIDGHKENYPLESKEFSLWAQSVFYQKTKKALCKDGLTQAVSILSAETKFNDSSICELQNRVARLESDFVYDLTNKNWSVVRINESGWSVDEVSKLFCRYRHQIPQIEPKSGGDLNKIFDYINMSNYQLLFCCWLVSCFVPDIPHPMPIFYGEKGAAKSTACVLLKKLIDPSVMETLTLSKDDRTIAVNLQQHYYLPFDNVSSISNEMSDTLCRAITGSAIQQRKLHTNAEDYIFKFKRCLTLNGINNVANRSDLLDRSIMFELERVTEDKRKELQGIFDSFEADKPYMLGAIFDVLSKAMKLYPNIKLNRLTRMADFCRWGYAIAEAMGGKGDSFMKEYKANQDIQNTEAINSDVVAFLIVEFMRDRPAWTGRISDLLVEIKITADKQGINHNISSMPKAPNSLSRRIKEVRSNLENVGITFEISMKRSNGTYITLNNSSVSPLPPYHVEAGKIPGIRNGDSNGDSNGDGDISTRLVPIPIPSENCGNDDNGDDGDDYADIEF